MQMRPILLIRGVLLVAVALGTFLSSPASAHGGDPVITVDQVHPGQGSTHYFVRMTWEDGDPITDGSLTATPIAPDGTEGELVVLESSGDGIYQGAVTMDSPGTWTVRFTTVDPPGSIETTQVVEGPTTTTAAPTTTTTAAPATTAPTTTAAPVEDAATTNDDDSDDDSSSALPLILGGLVLLAIVAGGAYLLTRRKPPTADGPDDPSAPTDVSTDTPT
jgi:hypothetical protein